MVELCNKTPGFGSGRSGYEYHLGVALAANVSGKFMRDFGFAAISHQPENYTPLPGAKAWKRIWRAVEYTVLKSSDNAGISFNWSGIPSSLASAGLSDLYQPSQQRTWIATIEHAGISTAGYCAGNLWLEFFKKPQETRPRARKVLKSQ